jgi:DNA-binding NarL/FixJ family response regulator
MIKILIVHEFPLMCNIISSVLDSEPDIKIVGCASRVEEVVDWLGQNEVDVVLVSSRLPDQGTIRLTQVLTGEHPDVKIIILGITESRAGVLEYVEAGANGYVLKESSLDDLLTTIRSIHDGKAVISPEIAAALIQRVTEFAKTLNQTGVSLPDTVNLTAREFEVLDLLGKNLSNQQIAERLVIEMGTVKNHVHSILNKLGVDRREAAGDLMPIIRERFKGRA